MIQQHANQLRTMVVDGLMSTIDWDAELLRPLRSAETNYLKEWVYIPKARGASQCNPSNAFVVVASPDQFDDSDQQLPVILALRALIRFHHHKTWEYDRADEDFPRYANLLENLRDQAIPWLRDSFHKVDGDPVPALAESLLVGARILNVASAHAREDAALIDGMFASAERPVEGDSLWAQVRTGCFDCRPALTDELLSRTGVRQGGAKTVFAVDGVTLLDGIRALKRNWQVNSLFPNHRSGEDRIIRVEAHVKELSRRLQSAIKTRREEVLSQGNTIHDELGTEINKQQIVTEVNRVIQATKQFGVKDAQDNLSQLTGLVERFRDAAVSKCLEHVDRIANESEGGALLSALAQIDDETLALVSRFVADISGFLDRTQAKINGELATLGANIVPNAVEGVDSRLRNLEEVLPHAHERIAE